MSVSGPLRSMPPGAGVEPPELSLILSQERINDYAEASGDHNPIHLDPDFARAVGLPSTIAHGLLTMAAAAAPLEQWSAEVAYVSRISCRFSAPVASGDRISGQPQVRDASAERVVLALEARNGSGEPALTKAEMELRPL
ncbi:MAG: MaoC/PaaZ C-terminal domain-containing protein [Candidatus Dormibacteria bacterium]